MEYENQLNLLDVGASKEQLSRWQSLSSFTSFNGYRGNAYLIDKELEPWANNKKEGPFRELYRYWMGAYQVFCGDKKNGIIDLKKSIEYSQNEGSICNQGSIALASHNTLAQSLVTLGRVDDAVTHFEAGLKLPAGNNDDNIMSCATTLSRGGHEQAAALFYKRIADPEMTSGEVTESQLSRRYLDRLTNDEVSISLQELTSKIEQCLLNEQGDNLTNLACLSEFMVPIGTINYFPDCKSFFPQLLADIKKSKIRILGLENGKEQISIITGGWNGEWLKGTVKFILTQYNNGWRWTGITLGFEPYKYISTIESDFNQQTNQPLPFGLLAPWDRGNRRDPKTFMAGGLGDHSEIPFDAPISFWDFVPAGCIGRLVDDPSSYIPGGIREAALATRDCGSAHEDFTTIR